MTIERLGLALKRDGDRPADIYFDSVETIVTPDVKPVLNVNPQFTDGDAVPDETYPSLLFPAGWSQYDRDHVGAMDVVNGNVLFAGLSHTAGFLQFLPITQNPIQRRRIRARKLSGDISPGLGFYHGPPVDDHLFGTSQGTYSSTWAWVIPNGTSPSDEWFELDYEVKPGSSTVIVSQLSGGTTTCEWEVDYAIITEPPGPDTVTVEHSGNLNMVLNAEAVAQHARQRLMTFEGEWFLDTEAGVAWLSQIMGQEYNPAIAEALVKAELLDTDGIESIEEFSVRFNRQLRHLESFGISVTTDYDERVVPV